jgi:hypothetical protein
MTEKIYVKLGEMRVKKNKGVFTSPVNGRKTYTKDQFDVIATTIDGYKYVGLKAYDVNSLHPDDVKLIQSHSTGKTDNGIEYYTFNQGRTLEEIKQVKDNIIKRMKKESSFPLSIKENEDTIFGTVTVEFKIPKMVIEKQKMDEQITWNCWDDHWRDPHFQNPERELLEQLYKRNGRMDR